MSEPIPGADRAAAPETSDPAASGDEEHAAARDLLDAELEAEIEAEHHGGAMVPVEPVRRSPGLWRRIAASRAGQRARSLVDATSNEPVLARLDELREQLHTRIGELEERLDRIEAAGQPSAQRLDEIAAELRTRIDRMADPNQAVLAVLDAQKTQVESMATGLSGIGERLERLEARIEEVWEVEEQVSQLAELRERVETLSAQQQSVGEALEGVRRSTRGTTGLVVLVAVGLAALAFGLLQP